ncbi:hypothetical protein ACFQ3P_25690 [Paraburkholderia sabiae]|uniref:Uncharacterized protein n=1 Tax=Paraburkholderia sabiae TaxID=273251 RepID=A0ABU9QLX4_9BURK|nr:hypothetical protein [Paraburkholderia sabiae]WJZ77306.1 hypothetical protein QEN71_35125 [Paraburkholderia sabiae]CAD6547992.1 hypothetical protein LMG24235_04514 [Paraburkholderia sabiae]
MSRIILFQRGESGGILIGANAVRAIPPFAAPVLAHLRAISDLLRASSTQTPEASQEMAGLTTKIANLAVERIEAAIGALDATDSLVYLTDDDGFVCGSTGAPPRPIHWPPVGGRETGPLEADELLAPDLVELLHRATGKGIKFPDFLEDPASAAKAVDVKLSKVSAANLQRLAPSRLAKLQDPVDRELVGFLHKVIEDGRFTQTWSAEPVAVSKALEVGLSDPAIDKLLGSSAIVGKVGDVANVSIEQGIVVGVVAVVLVVADQDPRFQNVVDRSGIEKF